MANSLIQQSGAQPQKQPRYVPIHIAKAQAGLVTNRAVLHDISIGIYARFYGGQPDALLAGSNVEISPQQTWKHRPGSSLFTTLPGQGLTSYSFFNPDGTITLYMDTPLGVYSLSPSGVPVLVSAKSNSPITATIYLGSPATITAANNFVVGQTVYIYGTTNGGGVLNGAHTVTAANSAQFQFEFTANVFFNASDTGIVTTAGQTSFLQIGSTLYMADGMNNRKVINGKVYAWAIQGPPTAPTVVINNVGAGAAASIPWAASTVFSTMGLSKDTNNNVQQLVSINADGSNTTSTVIGTSGVGEPNWNNTSGGTVTEVSGLQWECYGPIGSWVSGATYTNASNPGSAGAPAAIYDPITHNIFIFITGGVGTGTAGGTRPNFGGVPVGGHVGDHGFKWYNIGPAPTWKPSHTYAQWGTTDQNAFIIEPTSPQAAGYGGNNPQTVFIQVVLNSGGGTSDSSHTGPQWATTQANPITRDGQLNWQFLGSSIWAGGTTYTAWQAGTPFFSVIYDGTNFQVCIVGGASGGTTPSWQTAYGAVTLDGGTVQWACVGINVGWQPSLKWFLPPGGFAPPVQGVNPYGGSSILDSNGNVQFVINSGKSGSSPPVWATTIGATTTDSGATWTLTALASTFKGSTALAFTKGYGYVYAWKSRSATDFYVNNIPNGQANALGPPTGSGSGGITTASPIFDMPVGANVGAVMQISGAYPTDTQYDTVVIYRSTDGFQNGPYLELTEIGAPTPVNGVYQGSWTFYDSIPDIQLNPLIEADIVGLNSPPPAGLKNIEFHMNRIWGNIGNIIQASSGPDIPPGNGNGYEGWAPANTYPVESPANKLIGTQSGLLVFTMSSVFIVAGGPAATSFFPWRIARGIGLLSPNAIQVVGGEIYIATADKRFIAFQPGIGHSEPGFPIADQIATFNPANIYVTEHANGQDPSAFFVCDGVDDWFRLVPHAAPGFISTDQPVWSPMATIAGGATGVQSVVTAPGVRSLLIYQSNGTVLQRDLTTPQDNGVSFAGGYTVGSIVLAHPGQLAELGFVTFEFANQGSPTVKYLLNEISGTFHQFDASVFDPPLIYGTTVTPSSYTPNRYYFQSNVDGGQNPPPLLIRHMQLQVNYPAENFFHELYSFCIDGALHAEL